MRHPYPRYRDSGVEWLGAVPTHWEVAQVRRWFAIVNGGTPASGQEEYWDGETVWLTPDDLGRNPTAWIRNGRRSITDDGVRNSSAHVCPAGSIVMSTRAPIGHLAIAAVPVTTNQGCRTLVPDHTTHSSFAYYSLVASQRVLRSLGQGTTFMELTPASLGSLPMARPPLEEQRAIAAFLDRETGKIDRLVAKKRLLIERLDEYRQALITRTVIRGLPPAAARTAGLDPAPRLKQSGVEWLGHIPKNWEVARLKWSVVDSVSGVWGDEPDGENDVPCVRVADFDRHKLRVNFTEPTLRAVPPPQLAGRELKDGDLLLEKSGGGEKQMVGCVVLFDHDATAVSSNFIARISTPEDANSRYWTYQHAALYSLKLNYPAIKQTTGIQNLDSKAYLDTPTVFPPPIEQDAIAAFLDRKVERVDALASRVEVAIERLQEYRAALITASVTGKIDVRDDVSAEPEWGGA